MDTMTIVNFMPVYQQAPVSLHLLEENLDAAVAKAAAEDVMLLLPESRADLAQKFGEKAVSCKEGFGFVYTNDTAAKQVLKGEKPIPSEVTGSADAAVVSGEQWLAEGDASKLVWAEGAEAPVKVAAKTTGADLVAALGADAADVKALYLGYPQSEFVPAAKLAEPLAVATDYVWVLTGKNCVAHAMSKIVDQFFAEGCGRCVYGHEGGYQISVIFQDICANKGDASQIALLRDLCPVMGDQCMCEVGQTLGRTVLQALDLFEAEITDHFTKHVCAADECDAYLTYHILVSRCIGCGKCLDACEDDAIAGKPKFVHVINQRKCTKCNKCREVCPAHAVVRAGQKKPKTPPKPIPCRAKA